MDPPPPSTMRHTAIRYVSVSPGSPHSEYWRSRPLGRWMSRCAPGCQRGRPLPSAAARVSATTSWSRATTRRSTTVNAMVRSGSAGGLIFLMAPDIARSPVMAASAAPSERSCLTRPETLGGVWRKRSSSPIKCVPRGLRGSWRGKQPLAPSNPSPPATTLRPPPRSVQGLSLRALRGNAGFR